MNEPVSQEGFRGPRFVDTSTVPEKTVSLSKILPSLSRLICLEKGGDVTLSGKTVSAKVELRPAEPLAVKTMVANTGNFPARIYEGGSMVSVVKSGKTKKLPARGLLVIEAEAIGGSTYLTAITHRRGACGNVTEFFAGDDAPVGDFLL